jgi:adenosylcobyric acid synthase
MDPTANHRCRALMFQGTASNVGKSVLATAFCSIFRDAGHRVAPFKAQNWTLNPFITQSGSEIGWSQAVQAEASGVEPNTHMNPLLLKPVEGNRLELLIQGDRHGVLTLAEFRRLKSRIEAAVEQSYQFLAREYDIVVIEGAGTPTDVELREVQLANGGVAEIADAPVLLVGDSSKGGVFAALYGTLELLPTEQRRRVRGILINKFEGDRTDGATLKARIEERCGVPVLGLIPRVANVQLPHEGRVVIDPAPASRPPPMTLRIGVVELPHQSEDRDADPLAGEAGVILVPVAAGTALDDLHALILPGSDNTLADLQYLNQTHMARQIRAFRAAGGTVVGIGGGLQMLGKVVLDPLGRESSLGEVEGLGLLPIASLLGHNRESHAVEALCLDHISDLCGKSVSGYEHHLGRTLMEEEVQPFATIVRRGGKLLDHPDGAISRDRRVWGTYIHGLFDNPSFRRCFLGHLRVAAGETRVEDDDPRARREATIARIVKAVRDHVDVAAIGELMG